MGPQFFVHVLLALLSKKLPKTVQKTVQKLFIKNKDTNLTDPVTKGQIFESYGALISLKFLQIIVMIKSRSNLFRSLARIANSVNSNPETYVLNINTRSSIIRENYVNTGCQVFKQGGQNSKL